MRARLSGYLEKIATEMATPDLTERVLRASRLRRVRRCLLAGFAAVGVGSALVVSGIARTDQAVPLSAAEPAATEVLNGTYDLPAFPGLSAWCPGGQVVFEGGRAALSTGREMRLTRRIDFADVDDRPGRELIYTVTCGQGLATDVTELIAFAVAPLRPLGYVLSTPNGQSLTFSSADVRVEQGVISVTTTGPACAGDPCRALDVQDRSFAWREGQFRQVAGETAFPQPQPADLDQVDLRNALVGFEVETTDPYYLRFHEGVASRAEWFYGGVEPGVRRQRLTETSRVEQTLRIQVGSQKFAFLLVRVDHADPQSSDQLYVLALQTRPGWSALIATKVFDGWSDSGIMPSSIAAEGERLRLDDAGGGHRYYSPSADGKTWLRVQ